MSRSFEITIPGPGAGDMLMKLSIEADNWLDALRMGLKELGNERLPDDAVCDIQPNGVIRVRDPASGRTFVVRKLGANGEPARPGRLRTKSSPPTHRHAREPRPAAEPKAGTLDQTTANQPAVRPTARSRRPRVKAPNIKRVGGGERPTEPELPNPEVLAAAAAARPIKTDPFGDDMPAKAGDEAKTLTDSERLRHAQQAPTTAMEAIAGSGHDTPLPGPAAEEGGKKRPTTRNRETDVITIVCEAVPELENPVLTAEQIIDSSLDLACEHIPCRAAQFLLPGPARSRYRVVGARGADAGDLMRTWLQLEEWLADLVSERPATVRLVELELTFHYERARGTRHDYRVDSLLWVPIRRRGRLLAVILMLNSEREGGFSDGEVNALDYLAMTLSKALVKHL